MFFSSVAHILVILFTCVDGMIGKLKKGNSWSKLGVWEMSKSTTVCKCKILLLSTVVVRDRGIKLIYWIIAVIILEIEVDWIFLSKQNEGKVFFRTILMLVSFGIINFCD